MHLPCCLVQHKKNQRYPIPLSTCVACTASSSSSAHLSIHQPWQPMVFHCGVLLRPGRSNQKPAEGKGALPPQNTKTQHNQLLKSMHSCYQPWAHHTPPFRPTQAKDPFATALNLREIHRDKHYKIFHPLHTSRFIGRPHSSVPTPIPRLPFRSFCRPWSIDCAYIIPHHAVPRISQFQVHAPPALSWKSGTLMARR